MHKNKRRTGYKKLIAALLALNAAGVIICEQTHETGYAGLIQQATKTAADTLKQAALNNGVLSSPATVSKTLEQHSEAKVQCPKSINGRQQDGVNFRAGTSPLDDTTQHTADDKCRVRTHNANTPISASVFKIKQFYTSRGHKIDPVIQATVLEAAAQYGLCPYDLFAQIEQESSFNAEAVSHAGAGGLMQFMPKTWEQYGRDGDIHDVYANIDAGARYIKDLLDKYKGDKELAYAAYNAGPGNVDKWVKKNKTDWKAAAFNETINYVDGIAKKAERIRFKSEKPFLLSQSDKTAVK